MIEPGLARALREIWDKYNSGEITRKQYIYEVFLATIDEDEELSKFIGETLSKCPDGKLSKIFDCLTASVPALSVEVQEYLKNMLPYIREAAEYHMTQNYDISDATRNSKTVAVAAGPAQPSSLAENIIAPATSNSMARAVAAGPAKPSANRGLRGLNAPPGLPGVRVPVERLGAAAGGGGKNQGGGRRRTRRHRRRNRKTRRRG